jgi:hypothetical protein
MDYRGAAIIPMGIEVNSKKKKTGEEDERG